MKKLSKKSFDEIRKWIYKNARQIEIALWQYEFEKGSKEAVLSALSHYQNEDGGFGNALEPDCWNPDSSPYTTLNAVNKLKNIHFTDADHPIVKGIIKYLESGVHFVEDGWLFNIPSNNIYPRAPWWSYEQKEKESGHVGVTLGLVCFILQFCVKESELYKKALALAITLTSKLKEPATAKDMDIDGYCMLLEKINQLGLVDQFDVVFLENSIKKLADEAIVRDASKWVGYEVRPSQFISSPDSLFYKGNEDIVNTELDYLIDTRPENGVWGITWHWYGLYNEYPKEFAISENWWKSDLDIGAIGKLKFLRSFNRIE